MHTTHAPVYMTHMTGTSADAKPDMRFKPPASIINMAMARRNPHMKRMRVKGAFCGHRLITASEIAFDCTEEPVNTADRRQSTHHT